MPNTPTNINDLPDDALLRERVLVTKPGHPGILPFASSTLWRKVAAKEFPEPIRLSARVTAWRMGDVRAWIAAQQSKPFTTDHEVGQRLRQGRRRDHLIHVANA